MNEQLAELCKDLVVPPTTREEWRRLDAALRCPFEPWEVEFRKGSGNSILAYVDRGTVIRRLNYVVGSGNWTFDTEPLVTTNGKVMVSKGLLTICGVTKASIGDAPTSGNAEQSKTSDSDSEKRSARQWEVGASLDEIECSSVPMDKYGPTSDAIVWLRVQYAENRLWKTRGAAEFYGCTAQERQAYSPPTRNPRQPANTQPVAERSANEEAPAPTGDKATDGQMASIRKLCAVVGQPEPQGALTQAQAREVIADLSRTYQEMQRERTAATGDDRAPQAPRPAPPTNAPPAPSLNPGDLKARGKRLGMDDAAWGQFWTRNGGNVNKVNAALTQEEASRRQRAPVPA